MFNTRDKSFIAKQDIIQTRFNFAITYAKKCRHVFVFGGRNFIGKIPPHCEKYSVENNEWTVIKPMA